MAKTHKALTVLVAALSAAGCATQGGQVGSNASYRYENTGDGCKVEIYTGRESVAGATISVDENCKLTAGVSETESGSTSDRLIGVIDRLLEASP